MLFFLLACTAPADHDSSPPVADETGDSGDTGATSDTGDTSGESAADSSGDSTGDTSGDSGETADPNPVVVEADDPGFQYVGRILAPDPKAPELYWPGSAVRATFEGTSLAITLEDRGDNWVNVQIDGGDAVVVDCEPGEQTYVVAEGLTDGEHTVDVNKRTEAPEGVLAFHGFTLDPGRHLAAPPAPAAWRIEYFGDSITSGMSIESTCDCDDPAYKNNAATYAAVTARALGADYHAISISGLGIVRSWWPATIEDYWDSYQDVDHAWDFTLWTPQIVVINLGQNDKWLGVGGEITLAYVNFVGEVRAVYPDAQIFLALGSMDAVAPGSPFPGYVEAAVARLNTTDPNVHAVLFDYNGTGTHPSVSDGLVMADTLEAAIREVMPEIP